MSVAKSPGRKRTGSSDSRQPPSIDVFLRRALDLAGKDAARQALVTACRSLFVEVKSRSAPEVVLVPPKVTKWTWSEIDFVLRTLLAYAKPSSKPAVAVVEVERAVPTEAEMLSAGVHAFWSLAERWNLTLAEQCALLDVSESTLLRWRTKLPTDDVALRDRLRIVILSWQRLLEVTGGPDEVTAMVLRQPGSAENAEKPDQSLLEALSSRSVIEMNQHYQRLAALIHAS